MYITASGNFYLLKIFLLITVIQFQRALAQSNLWITPPTPNFHPRGFVTWMHLIIYSKSILPGIDIAMKATMASRAIIVINFPEIHIITVYVAVWKVCYHTVLRMVDTMPFIYNFIRNQVAKESPGS